MNKEQWTRDELLWHLSYLATLKNSEFLVQRRPKPLKRNFGLGPAL